MLRLELCSKPCLEEADDVGCHYLKADVPEDLFRCFVTVQARAEVVKHILIIPSQVACHVLELRRVPVPS